MNKPISIKMQETTLKLVDIINNSELPPFCIKSIINEIYQEVDKAEKLEIEKYNESLKKKGENKNAKN